jgi:hypothetical protein
MTPVQLNAECIRLQNLISEKGYIKPQVNLYVNWLSCNEITAKIGYRASEFSCDTTSFPGVGVDEGWEALIAKVEAEIAEIKPVADKKREEFVAAVGKLIDQGRDIGIEVDFLNPLTEMMKSLSSNIITNQPL